MIPEPAAIIRPLLLPQDAPGLAALDTSFTHDHILELASHATGFTLTHTPIHPPIETRLPLDEVGAEAGEGLWLVVEAQGLVVGLMAAVHHSWNRRTELRHLYLDPRWRGQGLGGSLVGRAERWARGQNTRGLWVETQHDNPAAVAFYQRQGFTLCGLDSSLYDSAGPGVGQVALFLFKPIQVEPSGPNLVECRMMKGPCRSAQGAGPQAQWRCVKGLQHSAVWQGRFPKGLRQTQTKPGTLTSKQNPTDHGIRSTRGDA